MSNNWMSMTAGDLGRGIGDGTINAIELTEAFLAEIAGHQHSSRIYSVITPERARAEALAADGRARAGRRRGPLDGVPISWKDNFHIAGVATEAGSALLKGRVAEKDSPVVARATQMGLVCLGKTHLSELAFSGLGLNPITATPPNVNDPKAVPGGSSSGAGASVAFGLAAAGIGTDTGGSIRIPSAWNDLVGLQTTPGRIDMSDALPLCEKFDTVGPLCRSVEDCALILGALEGNPGPDVSGFAMSSTRLAVIEDVSMDELREAPAHGYESALARLSRAGAQLERVRFPEFCEAISLAGPLFTAEAWGIWRDVIETAPEKIFPRILERFRSASGVTAADYVAGWRRLEVLRAKWRSVISDYDAVVMPTIPILPPDAERLMTDDQYYVTENMLALRYTRISNLMGSCGLTIPTSVQSCGIMFLGLPMAETHLLRVGHAAELTLR